LGCIWADGARREGASRLPAQLIKALEWLGVKLSTQEAHDLLRSNDLKAKGGQALSKKGLLSKINQGEGGPISETAQQREEEGALYRIGEPSQEALTIRKEEDRLSLLEAL